MIITTDHEAIEAIVALIKYLKSGNKETVKKPLTTREICEAISRDFKHKKITHKIAADKIGTSRAIISNQLTGKHHFSRKMAKKFSDTFGYSIAWLLCGEGEMFKT